MYHANLKPKYVNASFPKCKHRRIGEAKKPGPKVSDLDNDELDFDMQMQDEECDEFLNEQHEVLPPPDLEDLPPADPQEHHGLESPLGPLKF